jgi:hypothetical protein
MIMGIVNRRASPRTHTWIAPVDAATPGALSPSWMLVLQFCYLPTKLSVEPAAHLQPIY